MHDPAEILEEDLSSSDSDESDGDFFKKNLLAIKSRDNTLGFIIGKTDYFMVLASYNPTAKIRGLNDRPAAD